MKMNGNDPGGKVTETLAGLDKTGVFTVRNSV